jgi:hypothetical protein
LQHWENASWAAVFYRWRACAQRLIAVRGLLADHLASRRLQVLVSCVTRWIAYVECRHDKHAMMKKASAHAMRSTCREWSRLARMRRDQASCKLQASSHRRQAQARRAIRTWKQWGACEQQRRRSAHRAVHHWQHRTVSCVLSQWRRFAKQHRQVRDMLGCLHHCVCMRVFHGWAAATKQQLGLKALQEQCVRNLGVLKLGRSVRTWAEFAQHSCLARRRKQEVQWYWNSVLSCKVLHLWRSAADAAIRDREMQHRTLIFWEARLSRHAFKGWVGRTVHCKLKRQQLQRASALWRQRTTSSSLRTWRSWVWLRRQVARAALFWQGRTARCAFDQLLRYARCRQHHHRSIRVGTEHWVRRRMLLGLFTWIASTVRSSQRNSQLYLSTQHYCRQLMRRGMQAWKLTVLDSRAWRQVSGIADEHFRAFCMSSALQDWHKKAHKARIQRWRLHRATIHSVQARQYRAVACWARHVVHKQVARAKAEAAVELYTALLLKKVFRALAQLHNRAWVDARKMEVAVSHSGDRAVRAAQQAMRAIFDNWRSNVHMRKLSARGSAFRRQSLHSKFFAIWMVRAERAGVPLRSSLQVQRDQFRALSLDVVPGARQ